MTDSGRSGVRAVFVTWNPEPERFAQAVRSLADQVDGVIVVDNGSQNLDQLTAAVAHDERVAVVALGENLGVAAALNVGMRRALVERPDWIMTMDQDTLVSAGAVAAILRDVADLEPRLAQRCAIAALRPHPQPSSIWLTRYAERLMTVRELDRFRECRGVITSGNLVRATAARDVAFDESLFIDQVDFDFCASLRRRGHVVLQQLVCTTDHVLGQYYADTGRIHPYENAQRFYYVVRNSTYLVLRRRLLVRYYFVQVLAIAGAFVSVNGARALGLGTAVALRGALDAVTGRMGRREYALLRRGRR